MIAVPKIDEIADSPGLLADLPISTLAGLLAKCAAAQAAIAAAMANAPVPTSTGQAAATHDRVVDVKEAAERLDMHPDTLYRAAKDMPFTVRLGPGRVRFSSRGIDEFIRQRSNRKK